MNIRTRTRLLPVVDPYLQVASVVVFFLVTTLASNVNPCASTSLSRSPAMASAFTLPLAAKSKLKSKLKSKSHCHSLPQQQQQQPSSFPAWKTANSQNRIPIALHSDIPRDSDKEPPASPSPLLSSLKLEDLKSWMPPPPEDQFIMTGDVSVLFLYAFTSHYLNNFVVDSVISNSDSIQDALSTLDPTGEITSLQSPVWVDAVDQPQVVQSVLTLNAQDSLLNHWGPLFSTAGSACVALCTCWLIAGWLHKAFLFQNSIDCDTPKALLKTCETWISMIALMMLLTWGSNEFVTHLPIWIDALVTHPSPATVDANTIADTPSMDYLLTKADTMFLVDSASVLIAWRYMANSMMKFFR